MEKADSSSVLPSPLSISTKNRMTFLFANLKDRDFLVQRISDFLQQTTSKIYLEKELTGSLNSSDDEVSHRQPPLQSTEKPLLTINSNLPPTGLLPAWISALQQPTEQFGLRGGAHLQLERQQRAHGHAGPHDDVPPPLARGVQPETGRF